MIIKNYHKVSMYYTREQFVNIQEKIVFNFGDYKKHTPNLKTKLIIKSFLKLILILKTNFYTYFKSC